MSDTSKADPRTVLRGPFLSVMTVLFVLLALSDFTKALQNHSDPSRGGLVVLGYRLETMASNAVLGPIFGLFLIAYAWGIWRMKRWVLPISIAYAFYVPVNLVLFWFTHGQGPHPTLSFILIYLAIALTGALGTALYLAYHRDRLENGE